MKGFVKGWNVVSLHSAKGLQGKKVGKKRVDFYMNDCIVELKAKNQFEDVDFVQTLSYLRASGKKVALLLNFGTTKLEIKRIVN